MTIETSLLEQAYVKEESSYGTIATVAAGDAFRHHVLEFGKKWNREPSPEKRGTPDRQQALPRLPDTEFDLSAAFWEPSGTLGTHSYLWTLFKNGMGVETAPALNTTIASGAATTGATLTSVAGLAVGDTVVVTLASGARREITRIKTLAGSVVTWDLLSAVPDTPGQVVSGVNYKLSSSVPSSLSIFKYNTAGGYKEAVSGAIVNTFGLDFGGAKEVTVKFAGPARDKIVTGSIAAIPGGFTTVGSPASGLTGNFYVDGVAFLVLGAVINVEDNNQLRRGEIGTGGLGTGIIPHADYRNVKVSVTFYLEDTNLIGKSETITRAVLRLLIGNTNGGMVGAVLPNVEFEIPKIPGSGGPKIVTIDGMAYAAGAGNDQIYLGEH